MSIDLLNNSTSKSVGTSRVGGVDILVKDGANIKGVTTTDFNGITSSRASESDSGGRSREDIDVGKSRVIVVTTGQTSAQSH